MKIVYGESEKIMKSYNNNNNKRIIKHTHIFTLRIVGKKLLSASSRWLMEWH